MRRPVVHRRACSHRGCDRSGIAAPATRQGRRRNCHALSPRQPKASRRQVRTPLLTWRRRWPAEVNAIPALESDPRPAEKALAEIPKTARGQGRARKEGFDFNAYEYSKQSSVAGQTPRLLSLASRLARNSPAGPIPTTAPTALCGTRRLDRQIDFARLLAGGGTLAQGSIATAYCKALDAERAKRREAPKGDPSDPFGQCPKFAELAIIPKAGAKGGR